MQINSVNNINFGLGYEESLRPFVIRGEDFARKCNELDTWVRSKKLMENLLPDDMHLDAFCHGDEQMLMIKLPNEKYINSGVSLKNSTGLTVVTLNKLILNIIDLKKQLNFEYPTKKKSDILKDRDTEITAWHRNREINREKFANIRLANSLKTK